MARILFVCTGNIFRSLSAELARRSMDSAHDFSSAGTNGNHQPHDIRYEVHDRIRHWGGNSIAHIPRLLTPAILADADLAVAMDKDHQKIMTERFGRDSRLFMEIATGHATGIHDVLAHEFNTSAGTGRINATIDRIFGLREAFLRNLPGLLPQQNGPIPADNKSLHL